LAGGAYGLYKNWGSLFGGKKSENGQATVTPQSNAAQPAVANPSAATKATMIADEPVVPGQALSEKQMATIGMSKSMGNSYSADVEKQYQQQLAKSSVTPAAPTGTANKNVAIENLSKNNAAAKEGNNKPKVINNSQPAPAAPAPAPSIMMPRGQVRSSESAMERYSSRNAHFY
jgi:hypothetical protein